MCTILIIRSSWTNATRRFRRGGPQSTWESCRSALSVYSNLLSERCRSRVIADLRTFFHPDVLWLQMSSSASNVSYLVVSVIDFTPKCRVDREDCIYCRACHRIPRRHIFAVVVPRCALPSIALLLRTSSSWSTIIKMHRHYSSKSNIWSSDSLVTCSSNAGLVWDTTLCVLYRTSSTSRQSTCLLSSMYYIIL